MVVENVPTAIERWAIAVFGTADKAALAVGTVVIALAVGWLTGIGARLRPWIGPMVFGSFALVGVLAGWGEPDTAPVA
ncbi:MAG: oxidoreductase, partial [Actinobacteria bacterium]|nr:oxidoreductase [Actinomycetota bacterium]NIU63954.1 oxidoreductase [Actinomycetota bacterium]NIW25751.1 oxidoreductase [Actinomycetota bacterium]NIX18363.1 oxidoreductase [Actinomycetota bacterium]